MCWRLKLGRPATMRFGPKRARGAEGRSAAGGSMGGENSLLLARIVAVRRLLAIHTTEDLELHFSMLQHPS